MQFDEVFSVNISTSALFKQELNTDFFKTEILKFFDKKLNDCVQLVRAAMDSLPCRSCEFKLAAAENLPSGVAPSSGRAPF